MHIPVLLEEVIENDILSQRLNLKDVSFIIFDECHRSQFGDMHEAITKAFKKYFLFGFTGTPIFAINSILLIFSPMSLRFISRL